MQIFKTFIVFLNKKIESLFIKQNHKVKSRRTSQRESSQKRVVASQLKLRKGRGIKWILIENIYSLFIQNKSSKKTVYVFNQYPFNIPTFSIFRINIHYHINNF